MAVGDAPDVSTAPVGPSAPEPDPDATTADPAAQERSREAAGYRVRLRDAEAQVVERDGVIGGLRAEIDRLHRLEVERVAGESMASPPDLWLVTDLSALRDDTGKLDAGKVRETVKTLVAERPSWRRSAGGFDGGARQPAPTTRTPGLADLLKPEAQR